MAAYHRERTVAAEPLSLTGATQTRPQALEFASAEGRTRTDTAVSRRRILSPISKAEPLGKPMIYRGVFLYLLGWRGVALGQL
jgi:hypothetical protein